MSVGLTCMTHYRCRDKLLRSQAPDDSVAGDDGNLKEYRRQIFRLLQAPLQQSFAQPQRNSLRTMPNRKAESRSPFRCVSSRVDGKESP